MAIVLTKYGYAETSGIKATVAGHIRSVVHPTLALENGMHVKMGGIKQNKEIYEVELPTEKDAIWFVHSALYPYETYTTLMQHEMYLRKECGDPARCYEIVDFDRYAMADWCVTPMGEKVVKGNKVVVDVATGFLKEIAADADVSGYGYVGVIEDIVYKSGLTLVEIAVEKNETVA